MTFANISNAWSVYWIDPPSHRGSEGYIERKQDWGAGNMEGLVSHA